MEDLRETKRVLGKMQEAVNKYRNKQEAVVEEKNKEISMLIENKNKEVSSVIQERKRSLEDKSKELQKMSQARQAGVRMICLVFQDKQKETQHLGRSLASTREELGQTRGQVGIDPSFKKVYLSRRKLIKTHL